MVTVDLSDVDVGEIPRLLAEVHLRLPVGALIDPSLPDAVHGEIRRDLIVGAGFDTSESVDERCLTPLVRLRTLPDFVGPDMRLLVCGLNPSLHAADAGVGFVTATNRFWPAAVATGLVSAPLDPFAALDEGIGMTDLVKRATRRADELDPAEYDAGVARVDRLCRRLRPAAVCMVGLSGWRAAVDRKATAGWQQRSLGDRPVYVMPSTSGLNAHVQLPGVIEHLRRAAAGHP